MLLFHGLEDEAKAAQIDLYAEMADAAGFDVKTIDHALSCLAGAGRDGTAIRDASRAQLTWWLQEADRASQIFTAENSATPVYEWHRRQYEEAAINNQIR